MDKYVEKLKKNKNCYLCIVITLIIIYLVYIINSSYGNCYINITEVSYIFLFIAAEGVFGILLLRRLYRAASSRETHCIILCMNIISVAYLLWHDRLFLSKGMYFLFAGIFFTVSITGIVILWIHKKGIMLMPL